jgi:glyceraldehyde-3-phosphate dehydrogenase/erythrose-4-phosphate dehydrogenase
MVYRVAVNGFGWIGRNYVRAALQRGLLDGSGVDIVAVNDVWPAATLAHLLAHDSTFGPRDIIGDPHSSVFDAALTQADGHLVKVFGWYDNEWGYTQRLIDLTTILASR